MISNGYDLHFTKFRAGVFRNNQLVHKGRLDPSTNLFTIDLADMIAPSHNSVDLSFSSLPLVNTATKASLSSRKVLDVLWLH